ncbi:hypothetical protein CsSME_00050153 [Camellia sinensis var. sinensis]
MAGGASPSCIFCQIASSTTLLHSFSSWFIIQDFKHCTPRQNRHYLVVPVEHIPTVKDLQRRTEDFSLVSHMLNVGQNLLHRDAPQSKHRFGFHQPPLNSVNHLHLHCFALPYTPRWKHIKYMSLGCLGGFIEAEKLLERIKPFSSIPSKV